MIEDGLYAYLSQVPDVAAIMGNRLYPLLLRQKDHLPAGVYRVEFTPVDRTYCGTGSLMQATVQLDSYGRTYEQATGLADAFRVALLDFRGMMGNVKVKDVALLNEADFDDPEPGLYRRYQSWQIMFVAS